MFLFDFTHNTKYTHTNTRLGFSRMFGHENVVVVLAKSVLPSENIYIIQYEARMAVPFTVNIIPSLVTNC